MSGGITHTSAAQFAAATAATVASQATGIPPAVEAVRPDIHAIALNMPGLNPPYAFSYALFAGTASREVHLIDAGLDSDECWDALAAALRGLGSEMSDVASVTVTHMHPDHLGLAPRIREASGAVLRMLDSEAQAVEGRASFGGSESAKARFDRWAVPDDERAGLRASANRDASGSTPVVVDERVQDGDVLDLGGHELRVIHTPGHTGGHMCLAYEREGIIFTGDHVLPGINPGIALGGARAVDPLGEYYDSLEKLAPYFDAEVLPGHGFRFRGLGERCAEIRAHHERRTTEVAGVLESDPDLTVWEIASRITWSAGWENLQGVSKLSALSQVEMHVARCTAQNI